MSEYAITIARSARQELEALDHTVLRRILARLEALMRQPRPRGCRRLRGEQNLWRIRIGDYRVVYAIHDSERVIDITAVRHRREAYR